jgi:hypothetical protein
VVESIKTVRIHDGVFAPFTPSGKLLVNDSLLVSSFLSFDETSPKLVIAGIGFSYHWLAHAFEFPHRVACHYFMKCPSETYSDEGLSTWVAVPLKLSVWLLDLETPAAKEVLLVAILFVLLIFALIDFAFRNGVLVATAIILIRHMKGAAVKSHCRDGK